MAFMRPTLLFSPTRHSPSHPPTSVSTVLLAGGEGGIRTHGPREGTPVFKYVANELYRPLLLR